MLLDVYQAEFDFFLLRKGRIINCCSDHWLTIGYIMFNFTLRVQHPILISNFTEGF